MDNPYSKLKRNFSWYDSWHKHPRHQHAHWLFFFSTLILAVSFLSGEIGEFYLENEYQAIAQGNITLGKSGDRFTVNGSQQFLLMVSYFDAMNASDTILDSDFAQLRSLGFSGVRVLPNWFPQPANQLMDVNGNLRPGMLNRLINIIQKAQNNNLVVDVTFCRECVSGLSVAGYKSGIVSTAQGLTTYRNLYFDIQNEADHPNNDRISAAEAREIRDAVKAVDSQRMVSVSLISDSSNEQSFVINGAMDFHPAHGPFSTLSGTRTFVSGELAAVPGLPVHMQEPDRCRSNPCAYSASDFLTSATDAKCSGGAGWNFHTRAGYNLTTSTLFNQWLDPNIENTVANSLSSSLNGVSWGSCAGGPPPPSGPPPPPGQPPPGPSLRYIYYLQPYSTQAGQRMTIAGQNLATDVNFYNAAGTVTQATGILNRTTTENTVVVPSTLRPGLYTVSVGPNPESNAVQLEILAGTPQPPPGVVSTNSATPCDSATVQIATQNNVSIICDLDPNLVSPGDTVTMTGVALVGTVLMTPAAGGALITINGSVNSTGDLVDFIIPANTALGDYGLSNGNTTSTNEIITVQSPSTSNQQPPNLPSQPPPLQPNPPATKFNDLISNSFNYAIMLVGIAVFIMILWAGFLWLTSAANPGNIATAKGYIFNAIMGAVLLLSAYVILYTINPDLVGGEFNLKGIPAGSGNANSVSTQSLVALNEVQAASAVIAGCVITTEIQDFTAVDCPSDSSLASGLVQDPIIQTTDSNANNQVAATTLQNGGNNGNGRKIVILDTGYNYTHPELSSSYIIGKDFINNDADPMDDHVTGNGAPAHGSHVAGIITADGLDPRARGVAPGVGIIAGKILDKNGEGKWSYMTDAIYWAVNGPDGTFGTGDDFKADVINISVGGGSFTGMCDTVDETTRLFAKAIQYAKDNGVLVVISSGNISNGVSMPGCIDAALTVGAVDSSDRIANFSGRGSPVDIVAPGVNIYSSLLGNNYGTKQGTSQAAPVVSGIAALLKSANPGYTVTQLEQTLTSTACDLGSTGKDNIFGWGRVTAVSGSCTPAPVPPQNQVTGTLTTSPTSCTRGSISINPNCDITLSYKLNGITSPTQLTVRKNNTLFQNIQCNGGTCTGQLNDPDPNAGTYQYIISLPNNSAVAKVNAYIYTAGTITASFSSCAKSASPANPNCDVSLNINAPGITPNSIIVTRDGINWRVVRCTNPSCNTQLVDADPILGIHTYTLLNASNNSKLARATVTITTTTSSGGSSGPQQTITLCSDINYGGTCEIFASNDVNLSDNLVGNDTASSIILNTSDMRLCTDINYGGLCEDFTASDPDLSNNLIGNDRASSIGSM